MGSPERRTAAERVSRAPDRHALRRAAQRRPVLRSEPRPGTPLPDARHRAHKLREPRARAVRYGGTRRFEKTKRKLRAEPRWCRVCTPGELRGADGAALVEAAAWHRKQRPSIQCNHSATRSTNPQNRSAYCAGGTHDISAVECRSDLICVSKNFRSVYRCRMSMTPTK